MKMLFTFLLTSVFTIASFAQVETCDCKKDLDFLVKKMKRMPSFKEQVKNQKENEFDALYAQLASKMTEKLPIEACFILLSQQMDFVKDYHAYVKLNTGFIKKDAGEDTISKFKNSIRFKNHPRTDKDIETLKTELSQKPTSSFEGIYEQGEDFVMGIYKNDGKDTYDGIVLESKNPLWETGQIKFSATKNAYGNYDLYYYDSNTYRPYYAKNLQFENDRIWGFKKEKNENSFEFIENDTLNWDFKIGRDGSQYIRMKTFSGSSSNRRAQENFISEMEQKLTAGNLILDLRTNGGGSYEVSDPFLKLFKKKEVKVYVITNQFTGSNAEQFTVKLRELEGTVHLGQTTRGILAYGSDKKSPVSPSGYFTYNTTDMNFHDPFFKYEGTGVVPEIKLDFDTDWIEQTIEILNNTK
ncbi:S41 family peptidase [Rasiella sp. SM2506]|uniref:S41 family peptidase n=1 Tax=Rasiella sp. SM2506 TaxID=3423914 RepID=UPI003D7B2F34